MHQESIFHYYAKTHGQQKSSNIPIFNHQLQLMVAKYAAVMEPICTILRATQLDFMKGKSYIGNLIGIIGKHRKMPSANSTTYSRQLYVLADKLDIHGSIYRPYLVSIVSLLQQRFHEEHKPYYSLLLQLPINVIHVSADKFREP